MAGGFELNTRLHFEPLDTKAKVASVASTLIWELPRVGLLRGIQLSIPITIAGTLSAQNAYGVASAINRVRVTANAGYDLFNCSGIGYNWLLAEMLLDFANNIPYNQGKTAVTASSFILDMYIPIALNNREETGIIVLGNPSTNLTLTVEMALDTVVATGATVTGNVTPTIEYYEIPADPKDMPNLTLVHQCIERQDAFSAAGNNDVRIQTGGTILGLYQLARLGWTNAYFILQQSDFIESLSPASHRMRFFENTGRDVNLTATAFTGFDKRVFWDWLGTDMLGSLGSVRDVINTQRLTDVVARVTLAAADTIYTIQRQLIPLSA